MITKPENVALDDTISAIKLQYHRLDEPEDLERRDGRPYVEAIGAPSLGPIVQEMRRLESTEIAKLNEQIAALGYRHRVSLYVYAALEETE